MHWFSAHAPIRLKLLIAFGSMAGLTAICPIVAWLWPSAAALVGLGVTLTALILGYWYREAICTPYVTTVVRMEALAAGDLTSPIQHTEFRDCVGRMTKAMFAFRDSARIQIEQNEEAEKHAGIVRGMTANLQRLASGDLTADIVEDYPGAYAGLRANFNEALAALRSLIASVTESAAAIRNGSGEIAQASEDLARRAESNAASLEQTSAALMQIDGRIKATAEAAGRTVVRADEAICAVSGGRSIADEAVQAMGRVRDSAKGIDEVIEGVDKIAFQTRVLAMNAAVEAGRAGDAGRGFAVVADLVSQLAMRAEEEAKRARDQLTLTQTDIVTAVDAVQKIDGALTDISSGVGEVHQLLGTMAQDNQAQASAITQVSAAVASMDQSTQQNAAMVEETSAAARNLNLESESLAEKAGQFRIAEGRAPVRVAAKATPAGAKRFVPPSRALASAGGGDWAHF